MLGCDPGPPARKALLWTAQDFVEKQGTEDDLGGWRPGELLTAGGAPLVFQAGTQAGVAGLTLFPAVMDGAPAAFAITDIWQDHPEPWVQPVWAPLDENGEKVRDVWNVFPVDVDATFYSPFWRAELLLTAGLTPETYRSARDVLGAKPERRTGQIILCPIVPPQTSFADDGTGPKDPITLRPLVLPGQTPRAWVEGKAVSYLDFGLDRVQADGQDLIEAPAYFFVSSAGERPLPLAAVLSTDAKRNSLVRRVDVVLPEGAAAFVPSNRLELKTLLEGRQLEVPPVPAELDAFPQFALRVARDPECFTAAKFSTCEWLDTPARLEALQRITQPVQLAIGVVVP